jgi:hypothetical protein
MATKKADAQKPSKSSRARALRPNAYTVPLYKRKQRIPKLPDWWNRPDIPEERLQAAMLSDEAIEKMNFALFGEPDFFSDLYRKAFLNRAHKKIQQAICLHKAEKQLPGKVDARREDAKAIEKAIKTLGDRLERADKVIQMRFYRAFARINKAGPEQSQPESTWKPLFQANLEMLKKAAKKASLRVASDAQGQKSILKCLVHELAEIAWQATGQELNSQRKYIDPSASIDPSLRPQLFIDTIIREMVPGLTNDANAVGSNAYLRLLERTAKDRAAIKSL